MSCWKQQHVHSLAFQTFIFIFEEERKELSNLTKLSNFFASWGTMFAEAGCRRGRRSRCGRRPWWWTHQASHFHRWGPSTRPPCANEALPKRQHQRVVPPPPLAASAHVRPKITQARSLKWTRNVAGVSTNVLIRWGRKLQVLFCWGKKQCGKTDVEVGAELHPRQLQVGQSLSCVASSDIWNSALRQTQTLHFH